MGALRLRHPSIYTCPDFIHEHLRLRVVVNLPVEHPADGSLCSDLTPISISGQGLLLWGQGAIPNKPSDSRATKAILGPMGVIQITHPNDE
jgi:hypothetical protein